ncbi:YncE family protein [Candidatus Omnitrophota bacterium]
MRKTYLIVLLIFMLCSQVFAQGRRLQAEVFKIPRYKSGLATNTFSGIGIYGRTGNVCLSSSNGIWCEIPYRNGKFNFMSSFIVPTPGFKLAAVASGSDDLYVFDSLSNSIQAGKSEYKLSKRINKVSGMTYHKNKIYIANSNNNKIYELQLSSGKADFSRTINAHSDIRGLASDGRSLYSCDSNTIYEYGPNMEISSSYKLNVSIDGIVVTRPNEFLAIAKSKNEIYRFKK